MNTRTLMSLSLLAALGMSPVHASDDHHHEHHDGMVVADAWARATPPGTGNGAVYLKIHNHGDEDDRLVGGDMAVSERVEIHQTTEGEGMYRMGQLKDGLVVSAGEKVRLEPKSYHIMLLGLEEPLAEGDEHELTLEFEQAGSESVTVEIRAPGADGSGHHGDGHHHH